MAQEVPAAATARPSPGRPPLQLAPQVRLPHLPAVNFQCREPAPALAEGVDALEEAQVKSLAAFLRRVADNGDRAGAVRCRRGWQRRPPQPAPPRLVAAAEDLQQERARLHQVRQQELERARYEAERARRQYDAVEPENRLVARELERRWEEALKEQRRLEEEYARFCRSQPAGLSALERAQIQALAQDLPALWQAAGTTAADRQRIVRLLVEEVVVAVQGDRERVDVTIRWAGGDSSRHEVVRPVRRHEQLADYGRLLSRIDELRKSAGAQRGQRE